MSAPSTTGHPTEHARGCTRLGWHVRPSSVPGFEIRRCHGCGAVEIRTATARSTTTPTLADRNSPTGTNQPKGTK